MRERLAAVVLATAVAGGFGLALAARSAGNPLTVYAAKQKRRVGAG